mmetsp:Transcript_3436/g.8028  ORF Transcript_3436/g.8028 Transcript_3436/m.8028 type:complete len:87 (-) Transcript_3436:311-571(-)
MAPPRSQAESEAGSMLRPSSAPNQPPVTLVNGTLGELFASARSAPAFALALALALAFDEGSTHCVHRIGISASADCDMDIHVALWT